MRPRGRVSEGESHPGQPRGLDVAEDAGLYVGEHGVGLRRVAHPPREVGPAAGSFKYSIHLLILSAE